MTGSMPEHDTNPLCYVADSDIHGRGLFAKQNIPAGTRIGHYDGQETRENGMHVLWVDNGTDGKEDWVGYEGDNELRFLNHAPRPNGEMDGQVLYAARDILKNEEITIDYGEEFSSEA
jgi:SET domain-containing protein